MRELIRFATHRAQQLVDITEPVQAVVERSGIDDGLVHVYAQGATAAVGGSTMRRTATAMPTSRPGWWARRRRFR